MDRRAGLPLGVAGDGAESRKLPADLLGAVPPAALVLTGTIAVQVGAAVASKLFTQIPPAAVTGLRLWMAAVLLGAFGARRVARVVSGVVRRRAWGDAAVVVAFGLVLAIMNFSIYQAFARIPLGVAVTVEFLGPLAVAVAASRRALDACWIALALAGVILLTRVGSAAGSAHNAHPGLSVTGLLFALAAAGAWAAYILLSRATGKRFTGSSGLTMAMIVAAVAVTPVGVAAGGSALLRPGVLLTGLAIGLLSSIIPYSLELEALRRISPKVFGIWMSLDPAVAALAGLVILGQHLAARDWVAIACVMIACAGASWTARNTPTAPEA
jgi:inner membrane transporter RhtA